MPRACHAFLYNCLLYTSLSRGVVVINKDNKVTYVEYVPEVTQAVNFDAALEAIKADI